MADRSSSAQLEAIRFFVSSTDALLSAAGPPARARGLKLVVWSRSRGRSFAERIPYRNLLNFCSEPAQSRGVRIRRPTLFRGGCDTELCGYPARRLFALRRDAR